MQLDDLTDSIHKGTYRGVFKDEGGSEGDSDDDQPFKPHILDDSEQEGSDINVDEGDEESEEEDENESDAASEASADPDGDEESTESVESEEKEINSKLPAYVYRPTEGEDIYGRPLNHSGSEGNTGKYVPPARRQNQQPVPTHTTATVIDEVVD